MRVSLRFLCLTTAYAALTLPLAAEPVMAADTVLTARAGEHPDYDRVVFDWPRDVAYHLQRSGHQVTVRFGAPAEVHFNGFSFLTKAHDFKSSTDDKGNLVVTFQVADQADLKDFTSGHSVVIDVRMPATTKPAAVPAPAASPLHETAKPPVPIQDAAAAVPSAATPSVTDVKSKATLAPASLISPALAPTPVNKAVLTKEAVTAVAQPAPAPNVPAMGTSAPNPVAGSTAAPAAASPPTPASTDVTSILPPITPPIVASPAAIKEMTTATTPVVKLSPAEAAAEKLVADNTPVLVAALDPQVETRAVVWQRGGYAQIVFDRKLTLTLDAMTAGQPAPHLTLEPVDLAKASGFRFAVPADLSVRATRSGNVWKIFLERQQPEVPVTTTLVAQPDFALGARYLLPLPDAPDPIHYTDPVVGDDLILVPLNQTEAFAIERKMADFSLIPAAQGLVIKVLNDKVVVRAVSDGIEITAEGGLHLSSSNDTGASQQSSQKAKAAASGKSVFDFAAWRGKPDETFSETRQRLQQTVVDVPERERNRARLELARFYFAHGNGEEALGLLAWLAIQVPDLKVHSDFLALDGAAKILAFRAEEGLKELDASSFGDQPEIELWQAVGLADLRQWNEAEEKFALSEHVLTGYPEPFFSRFLVLAVESAVAAGKDHEAADWLDRLSDGEHSSEVEPAIIYLRGVLHAKSGRALAAEDAWKEVVQTNDRLYKIRAELALVDLGVANGSLSPAQAADRLEAAKFGWRGDDLEVDILHRLGGFYVQAKNVKAGLAALTQVTQHYPNSPLTPKIRTEMQQIFHDVFLGELGKNLSALDALFLYQQYRVLMPTGTDGIAVTRNLAERLVAIDLLQQAGDLLEDLVKTKLQGEEKGHASARLAAIRLLDHKPDAALAALDYSNGDTLPADLQNERQLLRAKALADLKRDDEALTLLQTNPRESAKLLRADINMRAQHWTEAAKVLLDLVGAPPKAGENIRPNQAEWLVNCAIAYAMAGDQLGLDKLAIDYGAAMSGTTQNDTFRLLTQPEKDGQLKDIAAAQSRIADVNLFQGFLESYRKTTDDGAAAAPPAK